MKHHSILLAFLVAIGSQASAGDVSCLLSSSSKYQDPDDTDQLIIRTNSLNTRAVLMTKHFTQTYTCFVTVLDEYECLGFIDDHDRFKTPTQLNVTDTKAGATVIATTFNLRFLGVYAADDYDASDYITRRFAISPYTIKSCKELE